VSTVRTRSSASLVVILYVFEDGIYVFLKFGLGVVQQSVPEPVRYPTASLVISSVNSSASVPCRDRIYPDFTVPRTHGEQYDSPSGGFPPWVQCSGRIS
jgi:hypothetical protein